MAINLMVASGFKPGAILKALRACAAHIAGCRLAIPVGLLVAALSLIDAALATTAHQSRQSPHLLPTRSDITTACSKPLYLTLDTGNMASAELIAEILNKHQVKASFFLANERTPWGNFALDEAWAPYWRERVREGHAFGNHTYDHVYFPPQPASDSPGQDKGFKARPQFGEHAGKTQLWTGEQLCKELGRVASRFESMTGTGLSNWWRAPGGKASEAAFAAARHCGYQHVHWASAGFLGDELPSERFSNAALLKKALDQIRPGDILMAHLGIWSRKEAFAPSLDPLIAGLKSKGFCFRTLKDHPAY